MMSGAEDPPNDVDRGLPKGIAGDPRERSGDVAEPPGKVWFRDLDEAVIENDRCTQGGTCVAACPSNSIGVDEDTGHPTLVRMCTGCSRCWDFCPRSGLRYERLVDLVADERGHEDPTTYAARAADDGIRAAGQDGGVVTTLLAELLSTGELDGALVARERADQPLRGESVLATTPEELREAAGSVYTQPMQLGHLEDLLTAADLPEDPAIALVGTPCVIEGAGALERYDASVSDPIALTVALMCTRSFEYERLAGTVADHGVDPETVAKLDVTDGVLVAGDDDGETLLETPVSEFDTAALRGCAECADFVGGAADISVGSVGSAEGYTTVVVRTDRGADAWDRASTPAPSTPALEATEITTNESLKRITAWNERRARETLPRAFDPTADIGITYEDHRREYDGTDREPRPLNPARVHQYEEWC